MYYIIFHKVFSQSVFGFRELEYTIYRTQNKEFAIKTAKEFNQDAFLNLTTEHFKVYRSETKTYNKKKTTCIYPSIEYPLFY